MCYLHCFKELNRLNNLHNLRTIKYDIPHVPTYLKNQKRSNVFSRDTRKKKWAVRNIGI
jgi:hypothetical protein